MLDQIISTISASISAHDFFIIGVLIFLEGILSIDNAVVLAIMAKDLPVEQRKKALTYGLIGAIVFRTIAISFTAWLIKMTWLKILGGAYLLLISVKHFYDVYKKNKADENEVVAPKKVRSFWMTVLLIELTDLAFAIDSILAAVAMSNKVWVIISGGLIGVILMRYAASMFIKLLENFPHLEHTAYQLVALIGVKVILDALELKHFDFHDSKSFAFWLFWILMATIISLGFRKPKERQA